MMLTEKATTNNNDEFCHNGHVPLASMWPNNSVSAGDNFHHDKQVWSDALRVPLASHGSCHTQTNIHNSNSHFYRPHVTGTLFSEDFQARAIVLPAAEHRPILRAVEVDVVSGRIRLEMEPLYSRETSSTPSPKIPVNNVSCTRKSWLTIFVPKWARKTVAISGKAAPKVKRGLGRSLRVIKHVSLQSASLVRKVSMMKRKKDRVVELNPKQDIGPRARLSRKRGGNSMKQSSSAATGSDMDLDEKHQTMQKSKRSTKKATN
jgi:hypothetical protein